MNYIEMLHFIRSRLDHPPKKLSSHRSLDIDEQPEIEVAECTEWNQLLNAMFNQRRSCLEHTPFIEHTAAAMLSVIFSTQATGAQLALRVLGPPGSAKSTLSECMAYAKDYIVSRSKFTGLVSGWATAKKSQMIGSKINNRTILVKDADPMIQMPNIKEVESEIRDALGDGVIRAEYRTGRSFEIRTLFTMIMCGTKALKQLDNAQLGPRFLDIFVHDHKSDADKVVDRVINSQMKTLSQQLLGGVENSDVPTKEIIMNIAPYMVGFIQHRKEQLRKGGIQLPDLTPDQHAQVKAAGNFVCALRARTSRDREGEMTHRAEKELATRISEHLTRMLVFLGFCKYGVRIKFTDAEFTTLLKIVRDTCDGFGFEIVESLFREKDPLTKEELAVKLGIGSQQVRRIVDDLMELGVIDRDATSNPHGRRGRKSHVYSLASDVREHIITGVIL